MSTRHVLVVAGSASILLSTGCALGAVGDLDGGTGAFDVGLGGRMYDKWYEAVMLPAPFVPDKSLDPVNPTGQGGPNGNGTLNTMAGRSMPNNGTDYRLKNFFGWDLRGSDGIYGPMYQAKAYVLAENLLEDPFTRQDLTLLLTQGRVDLPQYGQVLSPDEIGSLVEFIMQVRQGALARPDQVYRLDSNPNNPKRYVLNPGGDAGRGNQVVRDQCSRCHGMDGTVVTIDDEHSLGSFARNNGYEVYNKITSGQPSSVPFMGPQVPAGQNGQQMAQFILDVLAALCNATTYPPHPSFGVDVPRGDPRCGPYLVGGL